MSGNRSLDEFADAGAGAGEDPDDGGADAGGTAQPRAAAEVEASTEGGEASTESTEASTESVDESADAPGTSTAEAGAPPTDGDDPRTAEGAGANPEAPDPPASTYVWTPVGGPCAGCGSTVEERWRDGDGLVCGDCKDW